MQHTEHLQRGEVCGSRYNIVDPRCVSVASAALGAPQVHVVWQEQHTDHFQRGLQSPPTIEYCGRRPRFHHISTTWSTSGSFCVARQTLRAPPVSLCVRFGKSGHDWILWTPAAFAWDVQHLEHLRLILLGKRSTFRFICRRCGTRPPPERSAEARRGLNRAANGTLEC